MDLTRHSSRLKWSSFSRLDMLSTVAPSLTTWCKRGVENPNPESHPAKLQWMMMRAFTATRNLTLSRLNKFSSKSGTHWIYCRSLKLMGPLQISSCWETTMLGKMLKVKSATISWHLTATTTNTSSKLRSFRRTTRHSQVSLTWPQTSVPECLRSPYHQFSVRNKQQ